LLFSHSIFLFLEQIFFAVKIIGGFWEGKEVPSLSDVFVED